MVNMTVKERRRIRNLVEEFAVNPDQLTVFRQIGEHPRQHAEFVNQMNNLTACPDPIGLYRDLWADYLDCWEEDHETEDFVSRARREDQESVS
jgi:hypothetical protein